MQFRNLAVPLAMSAMVAGLLNVGCSPAPDETSEDSAAARRAPNDPPSVFKFAAAGKNPEGIVVNPVTHKAYLVSEQNIEGEDQYALFVFDNEVMKGKRAPKVIPIPNENEYIALDSRRNLIYIPTKYELAEGEPPDSEGETTPPEDRIGTFTVVDGNTDTVVGSWLFDPAFEPEGVAVDPATGIVYVAAKAPEGESSVDDTCSSGTPIPDLGEPGDVECWTAGTLFAFAVDPADTAAPIKLLKTIPAGDDPESIVFENGMIYAANEDDGTVTIATAVMPDGSGGDLVTDLPRPLEPYSLHVFSEPNPLACIDNKFEADKMTAGGGSVFITDDRSRVAKITGDAVVATVDIPGATVCLEIPNTDGGGANSANNLAFMRRDTVQLLYVVSEQDTVTVLDPASMTVKATIKVPGALHLDNISVDPGLGRVWITDEVVKAVYVLQGACATGAGHCRL